ncbi:DUF397 domain-containing protein [Streptomyces neyagawaensis]|uniref:DUF397 domain-containing protein n=1 Tax=Streptomyces neyagawaensis TaxID=42238 RepID=UPI00201CC744|nr:DUF397 domain-containing protein [Streptomyces neyagawaensis]MCL6735545.1 DUF397 domain-containing protein [Streptomyces neyagawaensis]MDE1681199.1 DUF397 domain-containing protein [Streptomyces neyagawaensis]
MSNDLTWFTSTYSSPQGDDCVEVSLDWRKSTYSSPQADSCVEVAATPATIHVRDSKDTTRTPLGLHPSAWAAFVPFAAAQAD